MKVGDLVTLSSYAMNGTNLIGWNPRIYPKKPKLVGLIVKVEENPHIRRWTSKNESTYYFINWINKDCPASRYGKGSYYSNHAHFFRNDLKFVK
jgi:hypothetical protein